MENGSPFTPDKPVVNLDSSGKEVTPEADAPQEAPQVEATPAPSAPAPTPGISKALKGLMEREKALREQQEALKSQSRDYEEAQALKRLAMDDPLGFLDRIGIKTDALSSQLAERENPDPTADIRQELTELRQQLSSRQQREEQERKEAALQEAQDIVHDYVDQNKERFPLTAAAGMHQQVYEQIYNHFLTTGEALSEEDAAKSVEDYLAGIKAKWLAQSEPEPPPVKTPSTTLTNSLAAQTPSVSEPKNGLLSEQESITRAAALLNFVKS